VAIVAIAPSISAQPASEQTSDNATRPRVAMLAKDEAYIRQAIRDAERWSATDRNKAIEALNSALTRLETDSQISEDRRGSLVRMLKGRIQVLASEPQLSREDEQALNKSQAAWLRSHAHERQRSAETIKRLMDGIKKLRTEGRAGEAARQSAALAQQFPANPAVQADNRISAVTNQLDANRQLQSDRDRNMLGRLSEVDKLQAPPKDDIEFPKDWKERTKFRGKRDTLTAKERSILQTLDSRISVNFKDTPLRDVLEYLQDYLGQPIVVDLSALKAAEISDDSPITVKVRGLSVRTLLQKVLADVGLTYTIHDDAIEVTTPQKARDMAVVRVYYVGDLLGDIPEFRPFFAAQLIDLIQTTVDPQSWRRNGGPGTILYHPATNSIVVKQGVENQSVISDSFR
jgi:hypothetical protein